MATLEIGPSIMCANFCNLQSQMRDLQIGGADYFHFDIMDGQFVPNITLGPSIMADLRSVSTVPFEAHLMTLEPDRWFAGMKRAGADWVVVHPEACRFLHRAARTVHGLGMKFGVALNPDTPADVLQYVLGQIDRIVVMTVDPGFAGQPFIPAMLQKIVTLKAMLREAEVDIPVSVDGAVGPETVRALVDAGATSFVGGTGSVFADPKDLIGGMRTLRTQLEEAAASKR